MECGAICEFGQGLEMSVPWPACWRGRKKGGRARTRTYLRKGETELLGKLSAITPVASAHLAAGTTVPVARTAHDLAHPPNLIDLVASGKQGFQGGDLDGHGAQGPDVDGGRVLTGT